MILFNASNVPTLSPFQRKQLTFVGDGMSMSRQIDTSVAPLAMAFAGENYPNRVVVVGISETMENAQIYMEGKIMNVIFPRPLGEGEQISLVLEMWY